MPIVTVPDLEPDLIAPDLIAPDLGEQAAPPAEPTRPSAALAADLAADAELAAVVAAMRDADRAFARAVAALLRLDGERAAREEGMTVDAAVRLHTGATRTDVAVTLGAADVLARMPVTAGLFERGVLAWGHVRALAAGVGGLDVAARQALDAHLGAHADRLARMDADGRLDAIDLAVLEHTPTERVAGRAERATEDRSTVITPRLDGSGTIFSDLDVEGFATVTGRLEEEADTPLAAPSPGDQGANLPATVRDGVPTSRARQLADALVRICSSPRTGSPGRGAPVRFTVVVDADRVTDVAAGTIAPAIAARPPRLVRRAIERLSCDAAYDVVVRDGSSLLAAQRYVPEVAAATRRAVAARDGGCRFPGCRAPASWCDVHHVTPRAAGGDHAVTNLVQLCRRHHTVVHRRGWAQRLDPDGSYTVTRRGRTWTTRARWSRGLPPPDPGGGDPVVRRAGPPRRAAPLARPPTRPPRNAASAEVGPPDGVAEPDEAIAPDATVGPLSF